MKPGLDIVVDWALVPGTTLAGLISTRVAKRWLPATGASKFTNEQAAIRISGQAQSSEFDADQQSDNYVFMCYGGTDDADDAAEVGRAVFDRFQKAFGDVASGGIVRSSLVSGSDTRDPDEGWPVHIAIYEILTA